MKSDHTQSILNPSSLDSINISQICDARDTICGICLAQNCDSCPVTSLVNDALQASDHNPD